MSNQREWSLSNLLDEIRGLKERMERVFPSYLALLEKTSRLPVEFERGWWTSRVEALLETVRGDYQKYQAQAQKADFISKFMALGIDVALKAGGMQPVASPPSPQIGISISPLSKIEPALLNDPYRQSKVIFITSEEFEAIAHRLKGEILKGTIVPKSEDEIPRLIRALVLKHL